MFNHHVEILRELARMWQAELIAKAEEERRAKKVIPMQPAHAKRSWSRRLGHRMIQWGFQLLQPEPVAAVFESKHVVRNKNGNYRGGQARRRIIPPPISPSKLPLYLLTRVTDEIDIETTQFGSYYLTYFRSSHRVAALERYTTEVNAREGHQKWASKNWAKKSFSEVVLGEE